MNLSQLLKICQESEINLQLQDEQLKVTAAKGRITPEIATWLKAHKEGLIERLKQARQMAERVLAPSGQLTEAPVTFAQQRFWLLQSIARESSAYHIPGAFKLEGVIQMNALISAFRQLLGQHQILTTLYQDDGHQLTQSVTDPDNFNPEHIQLPPTLTLAQVEQAISAHQQQIFGQPFDLDRDIPIRMRLVSSSSTEHVLLICLHHIAADAWSIPLLIEQLISHYGQLCQGLTPGFKPALQYIDVALWQMQNQHRGDYRKQLDYWLGQLQDLPPVHGLTPDKPRSKQLLGQVAQHIRGFSPEQTRSIGEFCQRQQITTFMLLHGVLACLLAKWGAHKDIVVGSPVSGRSLPQFESMIGCFINTLVIRHRIDTGQSFDALIAMSRQAVLDAFQHQDLPFDNLVDALNPPRTLGVSPVFQIMLALQNSASLPGQFHDLKLSGYGQPVSQAKFELSINALETDKGLLLNWQYADLLFEPSTIGAMAEAFIHLTMEGIKNSETAIGALPLVADNSPFNTLALGQTLRAPPPGQSIYQRLHDYARQNPQQLAVADQWYSETYQSLFIRIAHYQSFFVERGLQSGDSVLFALPKSARAYTVIMALWGLGICYVPISEALPASRIDYMAEIVGVSRVIVNEQSLAWQESWPEAFINIDALELGQTPELASPLPPRSLATTDLAYIIFTSGTTGRPKGVKTSHYNLNCFARSLVESLTDQGLEPQSVNAMDSPLLFDASIQGLVLLAYGHPLVAIDDACHRDSQQLMELIRRYQVANVIMSTSYADALIQDPNFVAHAGLNMLIGGEACRQSLWQSLTDYGEQKQRLIFNSYGPTETTVAVTASVSGNSDKSNIGRVLPGNQIYILDEHGLCVPRGMVGQIFIGGPQLSQGYQGREELTYEYFIEHEALGMRLYASGDQARWIDGDLIEYLGRCDQQLKLNGYRIECGDIESCLMALPEVTQVAVKLIEAPQAAYLAAFVVSSLTPEQLKAHCRSVLPDYMVPQYVELLADLPLSATAKIDRNSLQPSTAQLQEHRQMSGLLVELAQAWQSVLPPAALTPQSQFFSLGGHSLAAVRLVNQLKQTYGIDLVVSSVFEFPVLIDFCLHIQDLINVSETDLDELADELEMLSDADVLALIEEL